MNYLKRIAQGQWFLIVLVTFLVVGYLTATQFRMLSDASWLKWSVAAVVMFCMALPLEFGLLKRTVSRPLGPILATCINLIAIPLVAWPIAPFLGPLLGTGLLVAAATPTTLATGAVWTRRAGGDDSVAIMVTLITNALCFLVTPLWVYFLTGKSVPQDVLIDTIIKLLLFVVLPIILAQACRVNRPLAGWSTVNKKSFSLIAQFGVLFIVFLGAVKTGLKVADSNEQIFTAAQLAGTLFAVTFIHVVMFLLAMQLAVWFRLPRSEQIAVGFSSSQKTLMVGLSTSINLGVSIIPIVAYHAIQLIIDTVFADRFRKETGRLEKAET